MSRIYARAKVFESVDIPGAWVVSHADAGGGVYSATFEGPDASARARAYAEASYTTYFVYPEPGGVMWATEDDLDDQALDGAALTA